MVVSDPAPRAAADAGRELECPRCGSARRRLQEYCLECGQRLPVLVESETATAPTPLVPGFPARAWPVLVALVVAVLATAAVLTVEETRDDRRQTLVTPLEAPTLAPQEDELAEVEPPPDVTPALTPPPTRPRPARRPDARGRQIVQWPASRDDGFTVVLASLPDVRGRAAARAKATQAAKAGLTQVGVLDSDEYSSLHPGYYVVFAGIYDTRDQAENAQDAAASRGFDDAYAAEVAR